MQTIARVANKVMDWSLVRTCARACTGLVDLSLCRPRTDPFQYYRGGATNLGVVPNDRIAADAFRSVTKLALDCRIPSWTTMVLSIGAVDGCLGPALAILFPALRCLVTRSDSGSIVGVRSRAQQCRDDAHAGVCSLDMGDTGLAFPQDANLLELPRRFPSLTALVAPAASAPELAGEILKWRATLTALDLSRVRDFDVRLLSRLLVGQRLGSSPTDQRSSSPTGGGGEDDGDDDDDDQGPLGVLKRLRLADAHRTLASGVTEILARRLEKLGPSIGRVEIEWAAPSVAAADTLPFVGLANF
jgi:hypothetical protein